MAITRHMALVNLSRRICAHRNRAAIKCIPMNRRKRIKERFRVKEERLQFIQQTGLTNVCRSLKAMVYNNGDFKSTPKAGSK